MPYRDIGKLVTVKGLEDEINWLSGAYGINEAQLILFPEGQREWVMPGEPMFTEENIALAVIKDE